MLRISYVIDSGKIKDSPYFHIKKCVDTTNMGGRTYPVRYYPVAIWLRDRKGRAILCIALFPQSGDSSGAILGVRSVALLHVIDSGKIKVYPIPTLTLSHYNIKKESKLFFLLIGLFFLSQPISGADKGFILQYTASCHHRQHHVHQRNG